MGKKIKIAVLLLSAYLLVFWIGFKSGAIYLRTQKKIQLEKISIPRIDCPYYIVGHDIGGYTNVTFEEAAINHPIIKILRNKKLRSILKLRDIKIYKQDTGERIY